MFINLKKLFRSFFHASLGLKQALADEQNFRLEVIFVIIVAFLAFYFKINPPNLLILILTGALLLILELLNSIIERFIDILKPRLHHYVGQIKDLMSAAVLIAGIAAFIVAVIIFYPYFLKNY